MPQPTTKTLGLYDFFSVLLPGTTLLLGLYPFLPENLELFSIGGILTLIVVGFVLGRAVHSISVGLYSSVKIITHRQAFENEINSPDILTQDTINRFCHEAQKAFSDSVVPDTDPDEYVNTDALYGCVRSYTHIDARGISRKFQAIYGFHRSTWLVMTLLGVAYFGYVLVLLGIQYEWIVPLNYTPKIASSTIPVLLIVAISIIATLVGFQAFWVAMHRYKSTYVQYMITDFLALREIETRQAPPGQPSFPNHRASNTSEPGPTDQTE